MPGVTNKILAEGREAHLRRPTRGWSASSRPARIALTGNPLRGRFSKEGADRGEALEYYGLTPDLPVVLVVGGSLGTRSLNEMMKAWIRRARRRGRSRAGDLADGQIL